MKILIPAIVGAVIGYATNWLAIKMLFRPHTEKKIFGITVPLTPGLIPKEKSRIAKNVGETVGVHLLSPETVAEALSSQKIEEHLGTWVKEKIKILRHSSILVKDVVRYVLGDYYEETITVSKKRMLEFIVSKFRHTEFKDRLLSLVESQFLSKYNDDTIKKLRNKIQKVVSDFSSSKQTRETIELIIEEKFSNIRDDNRRLNEIIPEDLVNILKHYLRDNDDKVVGFIKEIISSKAFQVRISNSISEYLTQNSKGVMSMFIKADLVSGKIFDVIESYIESESNKSDIVDITEDIIDKILQSRIGEIFEGMSLEDKSYSVNFITNILINYITGKENQDRLLNIVEGEVKSSKSYISKKVLDFISEKIDEFIESEKLEYYLSLIVNEILESINNKPVSFVFAGMKDSTITKFSNFVKNVFDNFLKSKAASIIELLNLSRLVENQINNFDVAFAEELIIEIANKELRAITWVGAVLGAVLGGLSPFIQFLYR